MNAPANTMPSSPCRVSVVIKALNEERNIRTSIESALAALAPVGGEVILADSCSTDRTVAIASAYPITIVQLAHASERCCGIGPQLGYQFAQGEYVYILDGDMRMYPDFLAQAVAHLDANPKLGGVGGLVIETNVNSLEYIGRAERARTGDMQPGLVEKLDMGGLYRRTAVNSVGYFSDRNLHSYEEADLALRLTSAGWQLERLGIPAVDHQGHDTPAYQLLQKRWRSKYIRGPGEVLRAAVGRPHFGKLLRELRELRIYAATLLWLACLCAAVGLSLRTPWAPPTAALLAALPVVAMSLKKRSLTQGVYSVVSWVYHALGMALGFLQSRALPNSPIEAITVKTHRPG